MARKSDHIWPAYVDMMTVLLMVYLLIAMLFQVIVAINPILKVKNKPVQLKDATEIAVPDSLVPPLKVEAGPIDRLRDEVAGVKAQPQLIIVSRVDIQLDENDLAITIAPLRNFLLASEREAIEKWMTANKTTIEEKGIRLFALASTKGGHSGSRLSLQYQRALAVFNIAGEIGVDRRQINFENVLAVDPSQEDEIILKLR